MPPPVSYLDVTSFPYSRVITQAEFNGGTYGGVANQVWFRYIGAAESAFGGTCNSGGTFTPKTTLYESDGTTEIRHTTGAFGWWRVLPASTYYVKIVRSAGGASNFDFTAQYDTTTLNPVLPSGALIINDDEDGVQATAWQIDGTFLGILTQVPASETGDALANGAQLWTDRFAALGAANSFARFSASNTYLSSVSPTPALTGFPIIAHSDDTFYVLNGTTGAIATISQSGTVTDAVATLPAGAYSAMGVNPGGTIAYWAEGYDSPSIHRHDLVNDAPLSDLYTVPALSGGHTGSIALTAVNENPGEILVLSNGNVVTWYHDVTADENRIIQISAAGTLVTSKTYTGNYQYVDHLHYASDNPDGIHAWFFKDTGADVGRIGHLDLASGTLTSFDVDLFSSGENIAGESIFGPSASCTMLTIVYLSPTTGALQVVKATVPTGSPQAFSFNATGTGVDPTFTLHDGELTTFSDLTPGTGYSVQETVPSGWSVRYDVSNGSSPTALLVEAGDVTTVTVTNTASAGVLATEYLIRRERVFPVVDPNGKRIFFSMLQLILNSGNGITSGQGSDPLVELDWSKDGGHTWSNIHYLQSGAIGAYQTRVIQRRLGQSHNGFVFRVAVSDPVAWSLLNAVGEFTVGTA